MSQGTESDFVVLGAHVDDLVSVGKEDGLKKLNKVLRSEFEITVKQNPDVIMGMQLRPWPFFLGRCLGLSCSRPKPRLLSALSGS